MLIEKVILKESEIVEVDGEYKHVVKSERSIPCFLSNYSLKRGKELGLLRGSLMSDVMKLNALNKIESFEDADSETFKDFDEVQMMSVVYLGCLGAKPNLDLSFDEFVLQFHADYEALLTLYGNLLASLVERDPNQFAKGLQKSTKTTKKKPKPQP
jgi:hypothetical protein